jgi:putative serine protease PepD
MNDFETNPRRSPTEPGADNPHEGVSPAGPATPPADSDPVTAPAGGDASIRPTDSDPVTAPAGGDASIRPTDSEPVTAPQPVVHQGPYPPSQHWHPGQPQHPGWPGNGGYGASAQPSSPHPTAPPAPHLSSGAGFPPPAWAQPPPSGAHRPPRRAGKVVALGAAAVLIAVSSGLLGGVVANALDDDAPTSTVNTRPAAAAPVLDRSSLASIAAAVQPSVVSISTGSGEGSGVVLTKDGYILTNNHVVESANGDRVSVAFSNGRSAQATIVGTDPRTDLAVIKAEGVSDLRPATFGDSSSMRVGDTVLALGSPLGLQGSVTAGIVSALNRTIRTGGQQQSPLEQQPAVRSMSGLLQTDAPINPGNSGGALVNTDGEVIGINTAIATSGQSQGNIGVGFAIPSNKAKQVADQLMKGEKVSHPFIGVSVTDAENGGALVGDVETNSPAAKAGLQKGDVVTKIGDTEINDSDDLVSAVQSAKVGQQMPVTYTRNGDQRTTTVTLGEAS